MCAPIIEEDRLTFHCSKKNCVYLAIIHTTTPLFWIHKYLESRCNKIVDDTRKRKTQKWVNWGIFDSYLSANQKVCFVTKPLFSIFDFPLVCVYLRTPKWVSCGIKASLAYPALSCTHLIRQRHRLRQDVAIIYLKQLHVVNWLWALQLFFVSGKRPKVGR